MVDLDILKFSFIVIGEKKKLYLQLNNTVLEANIYNAFS